MTYKVLTLLIEILGNILGRQVNIAVMGKIWIGLKLFDHVNLLSLSLIALSSFLQVVLRAYLTSIVLIHELVRLAVDLDTFGTLAIH